MDLAISGKTAIVTGASSGIGRGIAVALGAEGVRVALVARREELLRDLASEMVDAGTPQPVVVGVDLLEDDAAETVAGVALRELASVDVLVNNAGGSRPLELYAGDDQWTEALTLNFTRHRQLTHRLLPGMIDAGWERVINITGKSGRTASTALSALKRLCMPGRKGSRARWAATGSP